MNVLFALHHSMACNSASHVDGIARELCRLRHDCIVAVPDGVTNAARFVPHPYRVATFSELRKAPRSFRDRRGPDVFHAWTPRERLRIFHDQFRKIAGPFHTLIHLEDNEVHIAKNQLGEQAYQKVCAGTIPPHEFPETLTHPLHCGEFFRQASGATVLIEKLSEHVPAGLPHATFWPAADARIWCPRPRNDSLREKLGIQSHEVVLTYHGNTHPSNTREIRCLYSAVAILNRNGIPARLVRVGMPDIETQEKYWMWAKEFSITLGYIVDRRELADVLAMADVFVQPGTSDSFNDYRFPSKLPEFFAMGRPVVLPNTNIGTITTHLKDAYVLDKANGSQIASAVQQIRTNKSLYNTLSKGARKFSKKQFSWKRSAETVAGLYARCLSESYQATA